MKKRIVSAIIGAVMVFSLAACGSSSGESDSEEDSAASAEMESASDEKYTISVILKTLSAEYWGYVEAGCLAYEEENPNVTVDVKGPTSETAYDEQQNMIEKDLNSGTYDAFIISPLQEDTVSTLISGVTEPVIAVDTDIDAEEVVTFVGTGNEDAAAEGAEAAVAAAEEAGWEEINAICISGVQGDSTASARLAGFEEGTEAAGGTFLSDETQYADAVADKAVTCMEAIMENHPEGIAIIYTHNDDMAMAAARAAEGNEAYENTIFCGFNGDVTACEDILDGGETMTIAQEAYNMGYNGCRESGCCSGRRRIG